jgi:predicted transcriptional regulator
MLYLCVIEYKNNGSQGAQEIRKMTVKEIPELIDGQVICCEERLTTNVEYAFSSDLMSDVLTIEKDNILLITGMANVQTIRTSEMSEIKCIIFARGKKIGDEMIKLARENKMTLIESPHSVFFISGELYKAGIKAIY